MHYPPARRCDQTDDYHGVTVADPYRWLEEADSPETREWIEAQNRLTESVLSGVGARGLIKGLLTKLWDYERTTPGFVEGGRYFYDRNDGLQPQPVLLVAEVPAAPARVLLDPNTLSEDGTVAVSGISVSPDGRYMAYSLSSAGSDWLEWHVRCVDTCEDLPDVLKWSKFSGASWTPDGLGFHYCRYAEPAPGSAYQGANYNQELRYHVLGTPQSADRLVYARPDHKEWGFGHTVTEDGRYLVIEVWQGTEPRNRVFVQALEGRSEVVELIPECDAAYHFLGNDGTTLWLATDLDAPNQRIISVNVASPARAEWRTVVAEGADALQSAVVVGDRFILTHLHDAHSEVRIHRLDGAIERTLDLPGIGTAYGLSGRRAHAETFYGFSTYTSPDVVYRLDVSSGVSTELRRAQAVADGDRYATRQVFVASRDGTRIPMFLISKRDAPADGTQPVLLYGYGGFRISLTPSYSPAWMAWLELGGTVAVANLRGGGEYGTAWHDAGRLANKQNVFDDFISAAEWLIAEGITRRDRLAIMGRSNGGLLVGTCMAQRPDLFGAALPGVGVMDMLRFHKFTIGWGWVSDYGCADVTEHFEWLRRYSPLHNLTDGTEYPATLVTTADHDDRVVPAHSFKFAAALQHAQAGDVPTLIRVETRAGHGAGKPTAKAIEETADCWAFLVHALNFEPTL